MKRHPHWETRLTELGASVTGQLPVFGFSDCAGFAYRALQVMAANPDDIPAIPSWHDEVSAIRLWRQVGGPEGFARRIGAIEVGGKFYAGPGDFLIQREGVITVVALNQILRIEADVLIEPVQLGAVPMDVRCWRIPS